MNIKTSLAFLAGCLALNLSNTAVATVIYADWTSHTVGLTGSAVGTIGAIGVTFTGEVASPTQTSGAGINPPGRSWKR